MAMTHERLCCEVLDCIQSLLIIDLVGPPNLQNPQPTTSLLENTNNPGGDWQGGEGISTINGVLDSKSPISLITPSKLFQAV